MRTPRLALSLLASIPLVLGALIALPSPSASAANADVVINEVESQDGAPDDWIELYNTGSTGIDISGWVVKDSTNNVRGTVAAATTLAPGAFHVIDAANFGDVDDARLFLPDTTTQVGTTYHWDAPAHGTYSRCPEGTGNFVDVTPSKGLPNVCGSVDPWPGGATTTVSDSANAFTLLGNPGDDVSGLAYTGSELYAVQNTHGTLYKLIRSGGLWAPDPSFGTGGAKALHYPGGGGEPDAEGVTLTDAGVAGGIFVSTERDATNAGVARPSILEFQDTPGGSLTAVHEWDLSVDLSGHYLPNQGLEGIAWVPDSYLVANGFHDEHTGGTYAPSNYPNHGSGIFLVGTEQGGDVYGYALDLTGNTFVRVTSFASDFPNLMDLTWEPASKSLWAVCDDTCGGRTSPFYVSNFSGQFTNAGRNYERPAQTENLNNEGFAIGPHSQCVGGTVPTIYADDSNDGGHVIRTGSLSCQGPKIQGAASSTVARSAAGWYRAPVVVTFTCSAGQYPVAGACPPPVTLSTSGAAQSASGAVSDTGGASAQSSVTGINIDLVAPTVTIKGVKKGKTYPGKKKPKCVGADALSGIASCTVTQKKKGSKYLVTATATDKAGNVTTVKLTYKVKKKKKK